MPAISIAEMIHAEKSAIESGWTEEQLLDTAGEQLGHSIGRFFSSPGTAIGYLGKGHNAGDTLVALRILRDLYTWKVHYRLAIPLEQCAPLVQSKAIELGASHQLETPPSTTETKRPLLLIDGLLGTGASGEIRDPLVPLAYEMSQLKDSHGAKIASVDLPSGIDADTGKTYASTITADATFMIGNAKIGLVKTHAANHTGSLVLVPVESLRHLQPTDTDLICPQVLQFGKSPRPYDFHKGMAGRVSILAGSINYSGAAALAALGALRGGAGLITLFVPTAARDAVTSRCPAEIMVHGYDSMTEFVNHKADACVIGCGLGELDDSSAIELFEVIKQIDRPTVLDADALNLISKHQQHDVIQSHHVLTPHPGEFRRLAPDLADLSPELRCAKFTENSPATLLLKGARTIVQKCGSPIWVNSTGNPGMATGGQGDLLAGLIGSQLALGLGELESAQICAWLSGRAAEIAVEFESKLSVESVTPSDVACYLGQAFEDWKMATR